MNPVHKLLAACQDKKPRICVLGDSMEDHWLEGLLATCQDGCTCFKVDKETRTPGGAANAARQLEHWPCEVRLLSFISECFLYDSFLPGSVIKHCVESCIIPVKKRMVEDGKIVVRIDSEAHISVPTINKYRQEVLSLLDGEDWDAVLISDYDKGLFEREAIQQAIRVCNVRRIPVVADAKRHPLVYDGAIIQCNKGYSEKHGQALRISPGVVVTLGESPSVFNEGDGWDGVEGSDLLPVRCANHVGAGDCFGAHLVLGLACGLPLQEAVAVAHSAGRIFVQHPMARPPWPHEIARDLDPVGGKVLRHDSPCLRFNLHALRRGTPGRIVFTNGVYRLPHVGHAYLLDWAKKQGDVLVVGINDDGSASRLRHGKFVLPLAERVRHLASFSSVDWIVPFTEGTPSAIIGQLKPDILVKGVEYQDRHIPGSDQVPEVRLAPMLGEWHASDLEDYRD